MVRQGAYDSSNYDTFNGNNENFMLEQQQLENIDAMRDPSEIIQGNFDQEALLDNIEAQSASQKESKNQMVQRMLAERQQSKNMTSISAYDEFSNYQGSNAKRNYMMQSE